MVIFVWDFEAQKSRLVVFGGWHGGLVIDAKDEKAKAFYMSQAGEDIEIIDNAGLKLWIPIDICDVISDELG